ncbi:MAG: cytochrome b N-terminal domain-containing protein [Phycisphaerales bacterium]|jgi:ubiquinol-cytochrome c reductase cytochrome b subunit|nr:cytochrome b N-terminal domain-containing protein [Phycisphaerales bacterium]MDP7519161.1 cytochrome b N-terminal domain-containing protein [Phycisphaerales bacterium]
MKNALLNWFESRLHLAEVIGPSITHPVPRSAKWWYVFGSMTLVLFICQIVTGICLSLMYVPSADQAFASLNYITFQAEMGWFLRAMHVWGSHLMVGFMTIHMIQVFLFGAYKYPRELTWICGVLLFVCTLGMAFTGQVLRWDQDSYWGLGVGMSMAGRIPWIGPSLVHFILGGAIIGGEALSRFFTLHVFILPASLIGLIGIHLLLVIKKGINEKPTPGVLVDKATYEAKYHELVEKRGMPFFPNAAGRDMIATGLTLGLMFFLAMMFGPSGPAGEPNPTFIDTAPRPDFYFQSIFAVLALLPPYMETFLIIGFPILAGATLILLPFLSGGGEKHWRRRPISVAFVLALLLSLGTLTMLGYQSPWSPVMDAWSGIPTPPEYVKGRTPLELQGAIVVQNKQCRNCHMLGGRGGKRGPALDDVASRLNGDQLIRQVIQGGGNMPAYGRHLSPEETTAVTAFLLTLTNGWEHEPGAGYSMKPRPTQDPVPPFLPDS